MKRSAQLLAAGLGAVSVLAFAPLFWWPCAGLSLLGLFTLWQRFPGQRGRLGFAYGLGLFTAGVHWIYISLHDFGAMPAPLAAAALLGFAALNAGIPAMAGCCSDWLRGFGRVRPSGDLLLLMPACWVLLEWVRLWLFTGFPWLSIGYSEVPDGTLAALVPIGGIYLASLGVALSAGALAAALLLRKIWPLALLAALQAVAALAGHLVWSAPVGPVLTVAILQGNVAEERKFVPESIRATLLAYREMALASRARLIVMPESALALFRDELPEGYLDSLRAIGVRNDGDLLVGLFDETAPGVFQNTMASLGVSPAQAYRKHHLVPFGEFIPLKPLLQPLLDLVLRIPISDQGAAPLGQPPLAIAGQQVAVDICYEDAFGDEIIEALPRATLLVNVSNDAWFGTQVGPEQHLQMAQARALETARPMLRATNTGVSALIGPDGRIVVRAPKGIQTRLEGRVQGRQGSTPFVRWGTMPAVYLCLAMLALALSGFRQAPVRDPSGST